MISFDLTKEQDLVVKSAKEFAAGELRGVSRECDETGVIPEKVLDKAWEIGLANAAVPESYGGIGMERSAVTSALVCEELAYGCASLASAILGPMSFIHPLIDFGTEKQKKKYLPLYAGEAFEPASMALHEPRHTFDPTDMKTTATKQGGEWIINGKKRLVPFGSSAHHFLVVARTGEASGLSRLGAFIVGRDAAGLHIDTDNEKTMGLRSLPCSALTLQDCVVPADDFLGEENGIDGRRLVNSLRIANSALCVGLSRAVMDYTIPYAKERIAFGEPIAKKQIIAFYLADMCIETDAMRWMVWKAASQLDQGMDGAKAATLAKHYVDQKTMKIADDGVQIFGGHGYIRDFPVEMWLRNARTLTVLEGMIAA
ncbi:MAG: acyl-CoA dehydrogenase family protein [Desulfobacterales bacterium]